MTQGRKKSLLFRITMLVICGLGFAYGVYVLTLYRSVPDLAKAKSLIRAQRADIKSLTARLEASKSRQKVAEQEAAVMRRANQLIREEESTRQAELNRLKGELDFYQRLAGTSGSQSGLAVYHLELTATGSERVFYFILTLTQNLRRSDITSGTVRIDLEGTLGDRPLTLPWSRITDGNQPEPAFRFKYFQQLDGYIALPDDFKPSQLQVSLETKGQKSKSVSRSFDWAGLTTPAGESDKLPVPAEPTPEHAIEREIETGAEH